MEISQRCKDDLQSGGEYINTADLLNVKHTTHFLHGLLRLFRWELTALQEIRHRMYAGKACLCQKPPQHAPSEECQVICIANQDTRLPLENLLQHYLPGVSLGWGWGGGYYVKLWIYPRTRCVKSEISRFAYTWPSQVQFNFIRMQPQGRQFLNGCRRM